MHLNSHVTRSVGVSLNPQEQYLHEGPVRYRDTVRRANIRTISATVREHDGEQSGRISFTLEGPTVNKDGEQGAVYRRFEMANSEAARVLPPYIYDAILEAFNAQGCPPLRNVRPKHPSEMGGMPGAGEADPGQPLH